MKGIAVFLVLAVAGVTLLKRHQTAVAANNSQPTDATIPSGVSVYDSQPAAQYPAQVIASLPTNPDSVVDPGYAPAFGPDENQVGFGEVAF